MSTKGSLPASISSPPHLAGSDFAPLSGLVEALWACGQFFPAVAPPSYRSVSSIADSIANLKNKTLVQDVCRPGQDLQGVGGIRRIIVPNSRLTRKVISTESLAQYSSGTQQTRLSGRNRNTRQFGHLLYRTILELVDFNDISQNRLKTADCSP